MSLLDLKTNFKSLKYGQDRPGGGSSGQPYVQYPLPEVASTGYLEFYENNKFNLDFPVRGGKYDLNVGMPYSTQAAKFDQERIGKFLKDAPRGTVFLQKQKILQFANPKIQTTTQVDVGIDATTFGVLGAIETTRIYNDGKNTLAQVGIQGSGLHFNRHGLVPIGNYKQTYAYVANDIIRGNVDRNRLVLLYEMKINREDRIRLNDPSLDIRVITDLGLARLPELLFQYPGGPNAIGGLGLTTIRRYDNTNISTLRTNTSYTGLSTGSLSQQLRTLGPSLEFLYETVIQSGSNTLYQYNVGSSVAYAYNNQSTITQQRLQSTDRSTILGTEIGTVNARGFNYTYDYAMLKDDGNTRTIGAGRITPDFRRSIVNMQPDAENTLASTSGYSTTNNIESKFGTGNPGSKNFKRVNYNQSQNTNGTPTDETKDLINLLDVGNTTINTNRGLRDMVTFRFDTIEINKSDVPIVFRAFLTGLQDNHSAEYNSFRYTGRGENFYTYNGFTRDISFNFKIAAQTRSEMRPLYRKLNFLLSQLYPDYKSGTGFMRAPMVKLTIGDYIAYQPGFLKSINITVPDDSPWEIANNQIEGADNDMYQLPHVLEAACNFTPVHNFLPRRAVGANQIPPFITPNTPGTNRFDIGNLK